MGLGKLDLKPGKELYCASKNDRKGMANLELKTKSLRSLKLKGLYKFGLFSAIQIVVQILGLATNVIIARKISVSDFGTYSMVITIVGIISTFGFTWTSSVLSFYGSKEVAVSGTMRKTIQSRNIVLLFSATVIGLAFLFLSSVINRYIGMNCTLLIFIWVVIKAINEYLTYYFIAREKKIISSTVGLIARVSTVLLLLMLHVNLVSLLWICILCEMLVVVTVVFVDRSDFTPSPFDKDYFKEIMTFALWQLLGSSAIYVVNFGDNLVIRHFMSSHDVGIYNAAYKIFSGIYIMANVVSSFYVATISRHFHQNDKKSLKDIYFKYRIMLIAAVICVHLLTIALSGPILTMLYPSEYSASIPVFQVLLIASICRYWTVFEMLFFNINKMFRIQQTLNIVCAILNIALDIALVPRMGIMGAAVGTTVSIVCTAIVSSIICEPKLLKYLKS